MQTLLPLPTKNCRARARFPGVRFEVADGADVEALAAAAPDGCYDKILIDVGGIAALPLVMALVGAHARYGALRLQPVGRKRQCVYVGDG